MHWVRRQLVRSGGPADVRHRRKNNSGHLDEDEKMVIRTVIESVLLRHEARRLAVASSLRRLAGASFGTWDATPHNSYWLRSRR